MIYNDPKIESFLKSVAREITTSGEFGKQIHIALVKAYFKGREDFYEEMDLIKKAVLEKEKALNK